MSYVRYQHDCSRCHFLGQHGDQDLYFCEQGQLEPTVIARHSDEPGDYDSGMYSTFSDGALSKARQLAQARGLLAYPWKTALQVLHSGSPAWALQEFCEHADTQVLCGLAAQLLKEEGSVAACQHAFEQLNQGTKPVSVDEFWTLTNRVVGLLAPDGRTAFSAMLPVTEWQIEREGVQAVMP